MGIKRSLTGLNKMFTHEHFEPRHPISKFLKRKWHYINLSSPGQNGRHFADDIFKRIFLNIKKSIFFSKIWLKIVPKGPIDNNQAFVYILAWRRIGDKPLCESIPWLVVRQVISRHFIGDVRGTSPCLPLWRILIICSHRRDVKVVLCFLMRIKHVSG